MRDDSMMPDASIMRDASILPDKSLMPPLTIFFGNLREAVGYLAMVVAALSIILPSIALAIFSRYEITRSVHEQNLLDLGYEEGTETGVSRPAPSDGKG